MPFYICKMKLSISLTLVSLLLFYTGFAQSAYKTLDKNNTSVTIANGGSFFSINSPGTPYLVPKPEAGSSKSTSSIFAGSIWVGALDENNSLHLAAMLYGQRGSDYTYGPSSKISQTKYDRIWKVTRSQIEAHIANPTHPIDAILTWPGNGNTNNNEPAQLAPYHDINKNGIYEPKLGDYPSIKGEVAAYCIYNDNKSHTESGGQPLNIDVHQLFFQESLGAYNGVLDHNNMAWFKIVNRSNHNYHDLKIGIWLDFDLGHFGDDYIGCDSTSEMMYVYNGDNLDEGTNGYGNRPPAQGLKFLTHEMSSFVYFRNDANSKTGNPQTPEHYYNYLNAKWGDSSLIYTYADGIYRQVDSPSTKFMYSGDPVKDIGWTEPNSGNTPSDRRGVASIGPFSLAPNASICFDIAFVFGRDPIGDNIKSIRVLKDIASRTQLIHNYTDWQDYACEQNTVLSTEHFTTPTFTVYPNPSTGHYTIEGLKNNEPSIITNITGHVVKEIEANATSFDITNLESGVYFLRTEAGSVRLLKM